jgi:hypothetical protein
LIGHRSAVLKGDQLADQVMHDRHRQIGKLERATMEVQRKADAIADQILPGTGTKKGVSPHAAVIQSRGDIAMIDDGGTPASALIIAFIRRSS